VAASAFSMEMFNCTESGGTRNIIPSEASLISDDTKLETQLPIQPALQQVSGSYKQTIQENSRTHRTVNNCKMKKFT
jgi:hypothetical protein